MQTSSSVGEVRGNSSHNSTAEHLMEMIHIILCGNYIITVMALVFIGNGEVKILYNLGNDGRGELDVVAMCFAYYFNDIQKIQIFFFVCQVYKHWSQKRNYFDPKS